MVDDEDDANWFDGDYIGGQPEWLKAAVRAGGDDEFYAAPNGTYTVWVRYADRHNPIHGIPTKGDGKTDRQSHVGHGALWVAASAIRLTSEIAPVFGFPVSTCFRHQTFLRAVNNTMYTYFYNTLNPLI